MGAVCPRDVVDVLEAIIQAGLRTAEVRTQIPISERLARNQALVRRVRPRPVPSEPGLIDRVCGGRRYHGDVQHMVMDNLRGETASIYSKTGLYDQVIRQVALFIEADNEGVVVVQLGIHLGRPEQLCRWRTGGFRLPEGRRDCGYALLDLLQAGTPEQSAFY